MTLILPTTATIADRAAELIATATRRNDTDAIAVLARVCENIARGAQLRWDMYDLHVTSANRPGAQYTVSCGVCDCPARKPCWHICAFELALELLDEQAGDADFEADADDPEPEPAPVITSWVMSDYAIRRLVVAPMVARTRQALETMRAQQRLAARICAARGASAWAA
jgi:hypothetical protein